MFPIALRTDQRLLTGFALLVLVFVSSDLNAQPSRPRLPVEPNKTPFAIAIISQLAYDKSDAVIVRRAAHEIPDVIVVRAGRANGQLIARALRQLAGLRAVLGDVPTKDAVFRVAATKAALRHERQATDWAIMLSRVAPLDLPGFGAVPHIISYLPNQAR